MDVYDILIVLGLVIFGIIFLVRKSKRTFIIVHKGTRKSLFEYTSENNSISKTVNMALANNIDLSYSDLSHQNLNCDFRGQNLSFVNFSYSTIDGDFEDANLSNSDFRHSKVEYCNFKNSNLNSADFSNAKMRNADLTFCDLTDAKFIEADVRYTKTYGSDEKLADFSFAIGRNGRIM